MNRDTITERIDSAIRFFLYLLIFWLPYSSAVVESCVISALILWIAKRIVIYDARDLPKSAIREKLTRLRKTFCPKENFLNRTIGFFIVACLLSVAGSSFFGHALRGFTTKTAEWFVVYFLVLEVFTKKKHLYIAAGILIFSALAVCLDGIYQFHISGKDIFNGIAITRGGATASFKHPNSLGGYLTIVVPLMFTFAFLRKNNKLAKLSFLVFFILSVWTAAVSLSRASWIGICASIFLLLFFI